MRKCLASLTLLLALGGASLAGAQEQAADDFRLWKAAHSYTDVIDAFDEGDPFDANLSVEFSAQSTTGRLQREINDPTVDGRDATRFKDIADHAHQRNVLTLGLDLGIYHDLALFGRLPLVLSDTRSLSRVAGSTPDTYLAETQPDGSSLQLFDVPFNAPARSGLDRLDLGFAFAIFDQARDPAFPTWLIMFEGRLALGEPMHACNQAGSYTDYNGATSRCNAGSSPGVSDGSHWLRGETRSSYRLRYAEPYAGLSFMVGFPASAAESFKSGGDLAGFTNVITPMIGELTAGIAVIPWEQRAKAQRFTVDLRLMGTYISEGHYYSPLFDALGTSSSAYLQAPNHEGYQCTGGLCAFQGAQTYFRGLTDLEPHGRVSGQISLEMQAAKYVRFYLGSKLGYETPYTITYADACNPNVTADPGDFRIGNCNGNTIINPHHRPNIDMPGQRFRVAGEVLLDFFVGAVGQF